MTHRVLVIQNEKVDPIGQVGDWLAEYSIEVEVIQAFDGEQVPDELPDNIDGLIVMGGAMGANDDDDYAWLSKTRGLLHDAAIIDMPTIGICLGAQVLATAVGGTVTPADVVEIGPVDIEVNAEASKGDPLFSRFAGEKVRAAQWHQDWIASLPPHAVVLAKNENCPVQAFRVGENVYGFQFHPELDAAMFKEWASDLQDEASQRLGIDLTDVVHDMIEIEEELAAVWRPVFHSWSELVKRTS
jgi:GMP synthase-like glutamine amidotransferase